ncbi:MAG: serine/threonine protein kinase [Myxococcaceae bacterium]|nr:serine/threonine protein kinase [Myxococcaceae bacterium]
MEHWRILESLGQRGQGALYRVEDVRHPGAPLTLKLSLRAQEGALEDKVARLGAAHSNLARLRGYGRAALPGGACFFSVRDQVPGWELPAWVEMANPSFLQIAALLSRLASALNDMHARDTWHREIHPDNIQVREEDGEPVLLDLRAGGDEGVDALLQEPLPPEAQVFRSPEALRFLRMNGGRKDARYHDLPTDDLYAIGATAYWLVTGHPPFSPSLPMEQLHTGIELRMPPPPWEVNPRVPRPLGAIIMRLMSKLPEARPQRGETLNAELMVAVSAGPRSMWATRVFDWERDQEGREILPRRVVRPPPPKVPPPPGLKLPRVVYFFSPPPGQPAVFNEGPAARRRSFGSEPPDPLGPWSRMM